MAGGEYTGEESKKMKELLAPLRAAVSAAEHATSVDECEGRPERVKEGKKNLAKYKKQIATLEDELDN